jgi:hypothetical protein
MSHKLVAMNRRNCMLLSGSALAVRSASAQLHPPTASSHADLSTLPACRSVVSGTPPVQCAATPYGGLGLRELAQHHAISRRRPAFPDSRIPKKLIEGETVRCNPEMTTSSSDSGSTRNGVPGPQRSGAWHQYDRPEGPTRQVLHSTDDHPLSLGGSSPSGE